MESEDDVSFLRNYLTQDLSDEMNLFSFGSSEEYKDDYKIQEEFVNSSPDSSVNSQIIKNKTIKVRTKKIRDIINAFAKEKNNYGVPCIVVRRIDSDGTLRLEHISDDKTNIDIKYAEHVLFYIYKVWGRTVELIRKTDGHTDLLRYDISGFAIDHATSDYPECIEEKDVASSW